MSWNLTPFQPHWCSRKNSQYTCMATVEDYVVDIFSEGLKPSDIYIYIHIIIYWVDLNLSWVICLQIIQLLVGWTGVGHRMISPKRQFRQVFLSNPKLNLSDIQTPLYEQDPAVQEELLLGFPENLGFCTWTFQDFWKRQTQKAVGEVTVAVYIRETNKEPIYGKETSSQLP